jgi:dye decolorizing peroxidase
MADADNTQPVGGTSRRSFLLAGATAGVAALAASGGVVADRAGLLGAAPMATEPSNGDRVVPFFGGHQAGVTSSPGAHVTYLSLTLLPATDRDALRRWLRILTDDAARLTQGGRPLADLEPELVARPAGLTVTFGFGPELVSRAGAVAPKWLADLPAFSIDQLEDRWSGADLLMIIHGDDPTVIAHAARMLMRDSRSFATLAWRQSGFRRAHGTDPSGTTFRNPFGQLDGTTNAKPDSDDFATTVWARPDAPAWLAGGTGFVLRRIAMDMDGWDKVGRDGRGNVVGRFVDTGGPLTGGEEHDAPDFEAKTRLGFPVINDVAHIRRAHEPNPKLGIVRMAFAYDDGVDGTASPGEDGPDVISNTGLLFGSWQADVAAQFVPMQARLAEADFLNTWTTPIGSVVVAVPPGCEEGGFIGEGLFA